MDTKIWITIVVIVVFIVALVMLKRQTNLSTKGKVLIGAGMGITATLAAAVGWLSLLFVKMNRFAEGSYMMACQSGGNPEWGERDMVFKHLNPESCVLEFGGGAGSVSSLIQKILVNKSNHVVVEPGGEGEMFGGLKQLRENKTSCNSKFTIIDHILEKGEGVEIQKNVSQEFDTIVADCEGCLHGEHEKNPGLFTHVKQIIVERDDSGMYDALFKTLKMKKSATGVHSNPVGAVQNEVWVKTG